MSDSVLTNYAANLLNDEVLDALEAKHQAWHASIESLGLDNVPDDARDLVTFGIPALLDVLRKGEAHDGEWRKLSTAEHLRHAEAHIAAHEAGHLLDVDGEPNLMHAAARLLMAAKKAAE
jgi:hypothetical protein